MAFDYINDAFKGLELLNEEVFNTSLAGINKLSDFMDEQDSTEEIIRVIDPDADTPADLQDSYVGKVIMNCNVCHSHIFTDKVDIELDDDGTANSEMQCPYCGETEGFKIVGEIAPYTPDSSIEETETDTEAVVAEDSDEKIDTEDIESIETQESQEETEDNDEETTDGNEESEDDDDESEEAIEEAVAMSRASRRIAEEFKEVTFTTEDTHLEMTADETGKVTITSEPVVAESATDEVIVPVSTETETEILDNNDVESAEIDADAVEDTALDVDFEDVDEEGFDELGESYLRKVYENVTSFKTTSVSATPTQLIVEGLITFNSGSKKNTGFIFEAQDVNSKGQLRFKGLNNHISESVDAFSLIGRVDNKKLFVESLKFNYQVNNESVRGIVRRK